MQSRERRDYLIISITLLLMLVTYYLTSGQSYLAITMATSAVVVYGSYWLGRKLKKKRDGRGGSDSQR